MAKIGILFDIDALGGGMYGFEAYKIFFTAIEPRTITGCTVTDGDTNATLAGKSRHFCIAVESFSPTTIATVKEALTKSSAKGLLPVPSRFLDDAAVTREPLALSFRINHAGDLSEVNFYWATKALEECNQARQLSGASGTTPSSATPEGAINAPRKWWQFWR